MNNHKPQAYFLFALILGGFALTFFVFKPFLAPLVLALVGAVVFRPIHKRVLARIPGWESLAAFITLLIIVAFVVAPLVFLGIRILEEAVQFYAHLAAGGGKEGVLGSINAVLHRFEDVFPVLKGFSADVDLYVQQGFEWLIKNMGAIFSNIAKIALSFFVFLIALYYLMKDGTKARRFFVALSPLNDSDDEVIFKKLEVAADSVVKGRLLIALLQGVVAAVGFMLFGVPNPFLWGSATALASLVPGVGTMLVFAPATAYLFLQGNALAAVGLISWGVGIVGLIDNLVAPKLLGRGTNLHPLLVLLSVLGGLIFFGPIGIFLGPLSVSFLLALLDLHFLSTKRSRE